MSGRAKLTRCVSLQYGAAAQLPHHGKALAGLRGAVEIVVKLEEAFEEPRLPEQPVVGQDRRGARGRRQPKSRADSRASNKNIPPRDHRFIAR